MKWTELLRAALGAGQLTPQQFWELTPVELLLRLGRVPPAAGMGRDGLAALMARFPDPRQGRTEAGDD